MAVFEPGGDVLTAIELTVPNLGTTLQPVLVALSIATRSLSRDLPGQPRQGAHRRADAHPDRLLVAAAGSGQRLGVWPLITQRLADNRPASTLLGVARLATSATIMF